MNKDVYREENGVLRNAFFYVLKGWVWLLVFAAAGLLVGSAYSYSLMKKNTAEAKLANLEKLIKDQSGTSELDTNKVLQYKEASASYKKAVKNGDAEKRNAAHATLVKVEKTLNENELLYYKLKYTDYKPETPFSKKWPAAFCVLFVLAAVVILLIRYFTETHIRTEEEVETVYGRNILAIVQKAGKKGGPGAWIRKWEARGKTPANNMEYLKTAIKTLDIERGVISGNMKNEAVKQLIAQVTESDVRFIGSGSLASDPQAQLKVKAAQGVILTAEPGVTLKSEFQRELSVAENLDRPVLGVIIIR